MTSQVSACPNGHALPVHPTRWFNGQRWVDGRDACRHCHNDHAAMQRTRDTVVVQ